MALLKKGKRWGIPNLLGRLWAAQWGAPEQVRDSVAVKWGAIARRYRYYVHWFYRVHLARFSCEIYGNLFVVRASVRS